MAGEELLIWGLALVSIALLLIVVEVFVPSGGLISLVAAGCAVTGVVFLFRYSTLWGIIGISSMALLGPSAFAFALRIWPSTPIGKRMLGERDPEEVEAERLAALRERDRLASLVGAEGVVVTDLRPVGVVQIGSDRYDALSETSFLRAGARVRVTVAEPGKLKVRAV